MQFETVIGLEIHLQLNTKSKLFCSCAVGLDDAAPNTNICPICTAQPGTLPSFNKGALELGIKAAIALNMEINRTSFFARKNYFYPDLPKSYQITQSSIPLAEHGSINIGGKKIGITRAHLEEDAGKSIHKGDYSLIDFNRSGVPLLEIVSEPDMQSPEEAYAYLTELKKLMRWTAVSDADMEKGELRVDVNISLRPLGATTLGTKVEIKNLNSFKAVKDALEYEQQRQADILSSGGKVKQETMTFDKDQMVTIPMRSKESAVDYRYFPEPDLPALVVKEELIRSIKKSLPMLPEERKNLFMEKYALSDYDAGVLTGSKELADYFEKVLESGKAQPKSAANWVSTDLLGALNAAKTEIQNSPVTPEKLAGLVSAVDSGKISRAQGKKVFEEMWKNGGTAEELIEKLGLSQVSDEAALRKWAGEALAENPKAAADVKSGNAKAIGALVGSVMKKSKGKANPALLNGIFAELLK